MKKGIAVPYIIAALLGIAVIGVIGYWLFATGGIFGGQARIEDCRTKLTTYCNIWSTTAYDEKNKPNGQDWPQYATGCSDINIPLGGEPTSVICNAHLDIQSP